MAGACSYLSEEGAGDEFFWKAMATERTVRAESSRIGLLAYWPLLFSVGGALADVRM